jgi:4-amino-4-deoxy-L-arabinose transferase-like glycosyltransferase
MPTLLIEVETETLETALGNLQPPTTFFRPSVSPISRLVFPLAMASLLIHFLGRNQYGFFRDELYYIACGNHLAFGYVDQPPLIALVARLSSWAFGNTMWGFRLLPALGGAATVLLTGWMTRELGGGRHAQVLACVTVLLAPLYLAFGSFLSMNAFEPLFWTSCAYILIRILKGCDHRLWLLFGAVAGVGLQNKHTMLMFGLAVLIGLMLTPARKHFRTKWFWFGGILAFLIFLPNLVWEAQHHWPQIECVRNCQRLKNTPISTLRFLGEQILFLNPVALPAIAAGLIWLFLSKNGKQFRSLAWAYLVVIAAVRMLNGKTYYPMPFYAFLLAAGGVALETLLLGNRKWLRPAYLTALVASGLVMLPFDVPLLPVEMLIRYQNLISVQNIVKMERDSGGEFHQLYADMFGWETWSQRLPAFTTTCHPPTRNTALS